MTTGLMSIVVLAGTVLAAPIKQKGSAHIPAEMEGKWIVIEATTFAGIEQSHLTSLVFVIKGDQYTATSKDGESKGRIKVDTSANPKRLEFEPAPKDGKAATGDKGRWIYELNGDELRIATFTNSGGTIPEKIDPTDPKQMILKAKRVKD